MPSTVRPLFPPLSFDSTNHKLWQGPKAVQLNPKTFTLLQYLVAHAGSVVTKEELLDAVWTDARISERSIKTYIQEIRRVLGDRARTPHYVKTIHGRGYQFIGPIADQETRATRRKRRQRKSRTRGRTSQPHTLAPSVIGRETEIEQLYDHFEQALQSTRQIVFISGEAGIGKTSVVDFFVEQIQATGGLQLGRGQCIEHYGTGEAYLPVLEALSQLGRETADQQMIDCLKQHAPTWLLQLPALVHDADLELLQRRAAGASQQRMLRELAEAVEALTTKHVLVLVLEDLHWSDYATLDWLAFLARRRQAAKLLVLATHRPLEAGTNGHPLAPMQRELTIHNHCTSLALAYLDEEAIQDYLDHHFTPHDFPVALATTIHRRTGGNPLFLVNTVEALLAHEVLVQNDGLWTLQGNPNQIADITPDNVHHLITQHIERLSPEEQRLLEVASVVGPEFSVASTAACFDIPQHTLEDQYEKLAQHKQLIQPRGETRWPDGTVAARYGFIHALYHEALYTHVAPSRRVALHRQIGEREEHGYGEQAANFAATLAVHFDRGEDGARAIRYHLHAGENALRRNAYHEAITHLQRGLTLLERLPETPQRAQQELVLQMALGVPLMLTQGYGSASVEQAFARARQLCQQFPSAPQLFPALSGLMRFYTTRGEMAVSQECTVQMLDIAAQTQMPELQLTAYTAQGGLAFYQGDLKTAQSALEQSQSVYDPQQHGALVFQSGEDPGVVGQTFLARTSWLCGYSDSALQHGHAALQAAREVGHPFNVGGTLWSLAWCFHLRREVSAVLETVEELNQLITQQEFVQWTRPAQLLHGWALVEQHNYEAGTAQFQNAITGFLQIGEDLMMPYHLGLLANAQRHAGQIDSGLTTMEEALGMMQKNAEHWCEAELYRIKGELLRQKAHGKRNKTAREAEAEAYFQRAITVARRQGARAWQLRATLSLSQLWQTQDKHKQARQRLSRIYNWFSEGFDTADLQDAKALLAEL